MKKILIILLLFNLKFGHVFSIEPEIFVQSTVNRASQVLSKDISKEDKINELKSIAKETVDIRGIGFYTLGSARKNLDNDHKLKYFRKLHCQGGLPLPVSEPGQIAALPDRSVWTVGESRQNCPCQSLGRPKCSRISAI